MIILCKILSMINVWTPLEEKSTNDVFLWERIILFYFFYLEEIRVCIYLQKTYFFSFNRMIYLLVKRIECVPRSTRLLFSFFRCLSFSWSVSCHFLRFFRKNRQTKGQFYLPTQESTELLKACRKPTKTQKAHNVGYLGNFSWRNYNWFIYWRTTTL